MTMKFSVITIFVLILVLQFSKAANILYLNGVVSPSHHIWNDAFVRGLAANGHNITFVTTIEGKNPPTNVHYIVLEGLFGEYYKEMAKGFFTLREEISPLSIPSYYSGAIIETCKQTINTNGFRTLVAYPDDFRFDLIIYDFTAGGCLIGFLHKFKYPPLLSVTAFSNPPYTVETVGGHHYYSYIPHYATPYSNDMNFVQRFYNFIIHEVDRLNWKYSMINTLDELLKNAYGMEIPSVGELEKRAAIAFVSTTPAFDYPQPLPENVIAIAGLHIREPKPLPKDLEDFIASSIKGAILFSLGSNAPSSAMPLEKQQIFLDAFEQFPDYHFVWKFEKPKIDLKQPKNVMIRPWLPQSDILNHPKTKAFITHSGLLSTLESIWKGVPMIGMPFGFDQDKNIMKSIEKGVAEQLDFQTISTEQIVDKLRKILENPKYMENAKKLSAMFKDQKETPLERAVWWAEWLIRNPNCEHLKSPVLRLGFIAGNSYDIIAFVSILMFIILVILIKIVSFVVRMLFGRSPRKMNDKQKQKKRN